LGTSGRREKGGVGGERKFRTQRREKRTKQRKGEQNSKRSKAGKKLGKNRSREFSKIKNRRPSRKKMVSLPEKTQRKNSRLETGRRRLMERRTSRWAAEDFQALA